MKIAVSIFICGKLFSSFQQFKMTNAVLTSADSVTNTNTNVSAGFLQDDNGNNSSMRLMCFISLITAIFFGFYTLVNSNQVGQVGTNLTFAFLVSSFGGKVAHKFAEK
jgi:hypothetical protein